MRSAGLKVLFVATLGLISTPAWAQEPPPQSSFTGLLARDYEVKAVTLVPLDVAKRATASVKTDTVVVTLQNKQSVAVCYIAFANWAFMNRTSLDTPTLCEVREGSTTATNPPPPGTTP